MRTSPSMRSARRATTSRPPRPWRASAAYSSRAAASSAAPRFFRSWPLLPGNVNVIEPAARAPFTPIVMKPWYPRGPAPGAPAPDAIFSVGEREPDACDRLERIAVVEQLHVVAEAIHVDAAVAFERSALAGHHRHAQL